MNTNHRASMLKKTRARDNEIILDDLEFNFPKQQLESITDAFNNGRSIKKIAKYHKRKVEEVNLALYHQYLEGELKPPKRKSTLLVPGKEQLKWQEQERGYAQ